METFGALNNRKLVIHLVAPRISFPMRPVGLFNKANRKTSLTINKSCYPTEKFNQSFLLVACTERIVTHTRSVRTYTFKCKYPRIHRFSSI